MLTQARLKEVINYDHSTGIFTWILITSNRVKVGDLVGSITNYGYVRMHVDGRFYMGHRLAWLYMHGEMPEADIDHINGVRSDNRLVNLRSVTRTDNLRNVRRSSANTSGITGVHLVKLTGKWCAQIRNNGRKITIGLFSDKLEAGKARKEAEVEYGYHKNHGLTQEDRALINITQQTGETE